MSGKFISATAVSPRTTTDTQNGPFSTSDVFKYSCDRSTICNQRRLARNRNMQTKVFHRCNRCHPGDASFNLDHSRPAVVIPSMCITWDVEREASRKIKDASNRERSSVHKLCPPRGLSWEILPGNSLRDKKFVCRK